MLNEVEVDGIHQWSIWNLKCEADSKLLINSIKNGTLYQSVYGVAVDILCIANYFDSISFGWIYRKENIAADMLAETSIECIFFFILVNYTLQTMRNITKTILELIILLVLWGITSDYITLSRLMKFNIDGISCVMLKISCKPLQY